MAAGTGPNGHDCISRHSDTANPIVCSFQAIDEAFMDISHAQAPSQFYGLINFKPSSIFSFVNSPETLSTISPLELMKKVVGKFCT